MCGTLTLRYVALFPLDSSIQGAACCLLGQCHSSVRCYPLHDRPVAGADLLLLGNCTDGLGELLRLCNPWKIRFCLPQLPQFQGIVGVGHNQAWFRIAVWWILGEAVSTVVCGQRLFKVLRLCLTSLVGNIFQVRLLLLTRNHLLDASHRVLVA